MRSARAGLALLVTGLVLSGCGQVPASAMPLCPGPDRDSGMVVLIAQAVPSAAFVPCISEFPAGWSFGGQRVRNGRAEFWMDSDRAGSRAVTIVLSRSCDTASAVEVPQEAGEPPMTLFEEATKHAGDRHYVFSGGCVTYRFSFVRGATSALAVEVIEALTFVSRAVGVAELEKVGVILCGRNVRCPG